MKRMVERLKELRKEPLVGYRWWMLHLSKALSLDPRP